MANELFHYMKQIEKGNYRFFLDLTDEEAKSIPPFQLLMWSQGSSLNRDVIVSMSDEINGRFFQFHRHPKLQYLLLVAALSQIPQGRLQFRKPKMGSGGSKTINAVSEEFNIPFEATHKYIEILSEDDVKYITELYEERSRNETSTDK